MALSLNIKLWRALCTTTALSVIALAAPAVYAQEVSGTIRGDVVDDTGAPLVGATVTVTHVPSGTRSVQTTDGGGTFSAPNLRIGGPYDISVAAPGFEGAQSTVPSISSGQPQRISVFLVPEGQSIEVTATRTMKSSIAIATGPATSLDAREITTISNVNRDIRNLAARDPLVNLDPTNGGAISIAGQNNRFNRFSVDGIAFGDPFGLESGGLASARGAVPIDAIGEFTVEIAPVDIQQGGFQGGSINAVLKSGGNDFDLGGFYTFTNDDLGGSKTRDRVVTRNFESKIFGGQITGPIIRDKLFFAVTYEGLRDQTPATIGIQGEGFANSVPRLTRATVDRVKAIANTVYGLDALDVPQNAEERDDKLVAKVDWNITDGHRAAVTYIYNKGNLLAGLGNSSVSPVSPTLALQSNNYDQGAINHYGVFQLNSEWSDSFSTQARVSYHDYERLQVPFSPREFGQFSVCTEDVTSGSPSLCPIGSSANPGVPRILLGPDTPRQANELYVQTLGVELQARITGNGHDVKVIAERRGQDITNLFGNRISGAFYFDSIADLQAQRAGELRIGPPIQGTVESITAVFQNNVYVFGVQDTWEINPDLTFIYGARYDLYETPDRPRTNTFFIGRYGFANSANLSGRGVLQPRFGLNWRADDRLRLRGSAGLFAGGSPNVWVSNNYSNTGLGQADITVRRTAAGFTVGGIPGLTTAQQNALGAATLNGVTGGPGVPAELIALAQTAGSALATTNALDPSFTIPSQWRVSGTVDYNANLGPLGDDWRLKGSVIWSKVKDGLTWTDLRSVPNAVQATLPDGRPRYQALTSFGDQNTDLLLKNTDRGYSWNIVGGFDKAWDNGISMAASYTLQRAKDESPGTSSIAFSNYDNTVGNDPNNSAYGTSSYQIDNSIRFRIGLDTQLFGENSTRFEMFFNSRAGQRFSHTMFEDGNGRSPIFGTNGNRNRQLLYVPDVSSATADPLVTYASTATYEALRDFIQGGVLDDYQGQIAPKNVGRSGRFNKLDLSVRQEIPFFFGGKIEAFADLENFLNLINKDWGSLQQVVFPNRASLVTVGCQTVTGGVGTPVTNNTQRCDRYVYSNFQSPNQVLQTNPSLWQIRVGVRIGFRGL